MKDRTIFVIVEAEELYSHPIHGGWDATLKVEVELQAADPSVGCPGGANVVGHEYIKFDRLSQNGFVVLSITEAQFDTIDSMLCELLKCLGDNWLKTNEDRVCEQACEDAADDDDDAREAAAEAIVDSFCEELRGY